MLKWFYNKLENTTSRMAHKLILYPKLRNRSKPYYKIFHILSNIEFAMRKLV